MKKLLIFWMLVMIPLVMATIECEISEDNSSWSESEATLWDGCIDDTNDIASIQNLDADTNYYLRCREVGVTDWGYLSIKTEESGGINEMEIATMVFFGVIAIVCLVLIYYLNDIAKLIPALMLSLTLSFGLRLLANFSEISSTDASINSLLNTAYIYSIYCFWIGVLVTLIIYTSKLFSYIKWKKAKPINMTPMKIAKQNRKNRRGY